MFGVRWTCSLKQMNCEMEKEHKGREEFKKDKVGKKLKRAKAKKPKTRIWRSETSEDEWREEANKHNEKPRGINKNVLK